MWGLHIIKNLLRFKKYIQKNQILWMVHILFDRFKTLKFFHNLILKINKPVNHPSESQN